MKHGKKIYFVLALHNHQPVGNLPEVFKHSFERTYEPFLSVLERFKRIRVVLHYTGSLLEWLEENQPSFIRRIRALVDEGRVEMLGGAYYEPIMPAIPDDDKIEQMQLLSSRLKELFGTRPRGLWLAERVWEPSLARPIAAAGLRYLAVDDTHFHDAGYHDLDHYFRTEEEGMALDIFPISEQLRYLIPFKPAHETIDFFRDQLDSERQRLFVLADDGEKFGGWPHTYETVYEKGWLEEFFGLLEEHQGWVKMVTFNDYTKLFPPRGPIYLPTGSYREMKEWSGGFWRNFLTRYPESNRMHKKMLSVRRRLKRLPAGEEHERAKKYIWAGQCNCAYWHGVFGGLYLNFLRASIWRHLLQAEKITDELLQSSPFLNVSFEDRSFGGEYEIDIRTDRFSLLFSPHLGGSLWELSWRPAAVNFLDTLTRRPEAYHREYLEQGASPRPPSDQAASIHHLKAVKEEGLLERLQYDAYPKGALIEHFLEEGATLDDFSKVSYRELGDFIMQPATAHVEQPASGNGATGGKGVRLTFRRVGTVEPEMKILLEKAIAVRAGEDTLSVDYTLTNLGGTTAGFIFAVELNLAFLSGYDENRYYRIPGRDLEEPHLASMGVEQSVGEIALVDRSRNLDLTLQLEQPAELWRLPVETISLSEAGLERSYQQSLLLPRWAMELPAGESRSINITLGCSALQEGTPVGALAGSEARV